MAVARVIPVSKESNPGRKIITRLVNRLRACCRRWRDRYYRKRLVGRGGVLANGVRWRFAVPEVGRGGFRDADHTHVQLVFETPCVVGTIAAGYQAWRRRFDIQSFYDHGRQSFAESLARRGYELADPDDPEGFFVRPIRRCAPELANGICAGPEASFQIAPRQGYLP